MIQVLTPDGRAPVFPGVMHMNTRQAELYAGRRLGKDWRERGYLISSWGGRP